jgi:type VI secretion system protein VasG
VLIMTSNAGTDLIDKLFADPDTAPDAAGLAEALRPELMKYFKPAFLGRVTIVPYFPLSEAVIKQIVTLQLGKIARRIKDAYKANFAYAPELVETIAARCKESSSGARNVENILSRTLLPELSAEVLARLAAGQTIGTIAVGIDPAGSFQYEVN